MLKINLLHCNDLPIEVRHRAEKGLRAILEAELGAKLQESLAAFQAGASNGWGALPRLQLVEASRYLEVVDRTSARLLHQLGASPDAHFTVSWTDENQESS